MTRPASGVADPQFAGAMGFLQQGRPELAEAACREIVRLRPRHEAALHVLGILAAQRGDLMCAIALMRRSLEVSPDQPLVHCNLGNALRDARRPEEALASYRRALELMPGFAGAHYNQGNALLDLGRAAEALACFDRAIVLEPGNAEAHNNRGSALLALDRPEPALQSYQRALCSRADFRPALSNCVEALRKLKRHLEALDYCDRLLALDPDDFEALSARGSVLLDLERGADALQSFQRALLRHPDPGLALFNRANAYFQMRQYESALADYEEVLRLEPGKSEALRNRGYALFGLQRLDAARASFDAALAADPHDVDALQGRGRTQRAMRLSEEALADFQRASGLRPDRADLLYRVAGSLRDLYRYEAAARVYAQVLELDPDHPFALGNLMHARLQICDWNEHDDHRRRLSGALRAGARACFPGLNISITDSPQEQRDCTRIFVDYQHGVVPPALWRGEIYRHEKIRIAYVSADFREHPVAQLLAGILERHDRGRFETFGISLRPADASELGLRIQQACTRFMDVSGHTDREIAVLLRTLEIDIAVDLMGYTGSSREGIFTHRPAPIQVNYLGYTATMGLPQIDYVLADSVVIPDGEDIFYTEAVARLPHCYLPVDESRLLDDPAPARAQCGLPESGFVFCCFNTAYKITPPVFSIWMRLLRAVPGSVLWLAEGPAAAARNLCREAERHHVTAERLIFAPRIADPKQHLARYRAADLFLDTVPFNAHATASDVLSVGLPILTCRGGTFAGRVAASLLVAIGASDLIASDLAQYEQMALRLAESPGTLADLRRRLVGNRRALFDTDRARRNLEAAYSAMWQRYQDGESPRSFSLPPV